MNRPAPPGAGPALSELFPILTLLWLGGAATRIPLLAVPPVIPLIHDDMHMSETEVGLLIGLPLTMFALAAVPGSLLIARFGVRSVAVAGLSILALASAARAATSEVWALYATTLVMGFGVAIYQPAMPTLVRLWAPTRAWLANAFSTNGMLIGSSFASALTIPLVLPLVGGSWRLALLAWSALVLLVALLFAIAAPHQRAAPTAAFSPPARWWPDWRSPVLWLLGICLGLNNALFFAANAFIPDYLTHTGRSDMIGLALGFLNGSQLIGSFAMLGMPERLQRGIWPFTIFGPVSALGLIGIVTGDDFWVVVSAAAAGFGAAVTFVVTFGLPAILSPDGEVHRMAGGMFTISYSIAVILPIICGASWDLTGLPWMAFVPMALCAAAVAVFGTALTLRSAHQR